MKRYFKVLDGSGVGFGLDFTGQILEFVNMHSAVPDYVCLRQPEKDINGKLCAVGGIVHIDLNKLEEVNVKSVLLSLDKWSEILIILGSNVYRIEAAIEQDKAWFDKDTPDPELQAELEEARSLYQEVHKQVKE